MVMSPSAPASAPALHALRLTHGVHGDDMLYRFDKHTRLRLLPDATLLGRRLQLYTNYQPTHDGGGDSFERSRYYALEWRRVTDSDSDAGESLGTSLLVADDDVCAEILLTRPGSYHYYFTYDTDQQSSSRPAGSGWVVVEPALHVGGRALPLDAVSCVTCVTRCLGPLSRWERALRPCVEAGYNLLHLTPVQQLGASGSSYCIEDQLKPDKGLGISSWSELESLVGRLRAQGVGVVSDVVLNHTANETPWLDEHPEATYNCTTCPHLRPAALLDHTIWRVSMDIAAGALPAVPRGRDVTEESLRGAGEEVSRRARDLQLHQFYQCDVDALHRAFMQLAKDRVPPPEGVETEEARLQLVPDPARRRLCAAVDMELALRLYNRRHAHAHDEGQRLKVCADNFRRAVEGLNALAASEMESHVSAAVGNLMAGARYERLQGDGPRLGPVTAAAPLYPRYFSWPHQADTMDAADVERLVWGAKGAMVRAHNGWVMNADPLDDFAALRADGRVYLRRELLAWGDSVKLRYGDAPKDSPFLWKHVKEYVELTAELFVGVRLDNCHSTPMHVAEYMLDAARAVNPDLYVVAELFTNSPRTDNVYVNRLGITALIRECQSAWDAHEQGRLVHRFGGRAVGALSRGAGEGATPCLPRALLMDQTHDNPSGLTRRSVHDVLPTAAFTAAATCASGSTRGVDELVPHAVSVVEERRLYAEWGDAPHHVGAHSALLPARRLLNDLHAHLANHGYSEAFVDQMSADVVAVTRHHPQTRHSIIVIAATAFSHHPPPAGYGVPPLRVEGELVEVMFEARLVWSGVGPEPTPQAHVRHPDVIDGYHGYECRVTRNVAVEDAQWIGRADIAAGVTTLHWRGNVPPGAVMALKVRPFANVRDTLQRLHALLARPLHSDPLELRAALEPLELVEYNALLYRCDAEERECSGGGEGVYDVPGHGPFVYAGLQGVESLLSVVRRGDDLGHALCANLRAGDWLQQHTWRRLHGPRLQPVADAYRRALDLLTDLPRFLQPTYYDAIVQRLHAAVTAAALQRMRPTAGMGPIARDLALCSVQLVGRVPSALLPAFVPLPACTGSLAAGLPHFSTGYMRCWGRDTFVALRGLLMLPGRWDEARAHILAYGACLRHGLVPNLLDGGRSARYNCRDAVWWWLHAVMHYTQHAPDGAALLRAAVPRLYPTDDAPPPADPLAAPLPVQPLCDVIQEALTAHFEGRTFRERNAGRQLDAHMADEGFTVTIGVSPDTGFVFGGNEHNCGTWMDKMGSSERAGIRGRPATPRDGSAIELVALSHAALLWLHGEHAAGRTPHAGVTRTHAAAGARTAWTWLQWADRIKDNFERHFWIPSSPSAADARPDLVHRRGIYKDTYGATRPYGDYQLRCNIVLAMAASPTLFNPQHAWTALLMVEQHLLGTMGLRTLDPADWTYRPRYDPADDSTDPLTAHGYNYHQGPQWTWPIGAYVCAKLHYARLTNNSARAAPHALRALASLVGELRAEPWRSLPELGHGDGARCEPSCRAQAWSCAAVLDALHALRAD